MSNAEVKMNMSGLVAISNAANEKIALPLAQRIASRAGSGYRVQSTPRTGVVGWARTRVITDTPTAMAREVRTGALARALGGR